MSFICNKCAYQWFERLKTTDSPFKRHPGDWRVVLCNLKYWIISISIHCLKEKTKTGREIKVEKGGVLNNLTQNVMTFSRE